MSNVNDRKQAQNRLINSLGELVRLCRSHHQAVAPLNYDTYQPSSMFDAIRTRCQSIERTAWAVIPTGEIWDMVTVTDALRTSVANLGNTLNADLVSRKGLKDRDVIRELDRIKDEHLSAFDSAYYTFESATRHLDRPQDVLLTSMQESYDNILKIKEQIEAQKNAADDVVTGLRDLSRGVSLSSYAKDFKDQASDLETEAGWWLFGAGSLALLTLGAAITFVCLLYKDDAANLPADPTSRIILFASKLAILGFLASAATYAARMSKSIKHNALSFSLRGRALETMHLIIQNAEDPHTKAGIIQQVTMCIFSHQPTGLIGSETDTSMTPQMIELIRSVSSPPGKA